MNELTTGLKQASAPLKFEIFIVPLKGVPVVVVLVVLVVIVAGGSVSVVPLVPE